ncbi:hypothetical protein NC652_004579 [Populus alba x Populus x berolinensis]|nr:hypothetical protein NC652_004579 [Populus alba x Populus x berolinensis]
MSVGTPQVFHHVLMATCQEKQAYLVHYAC